MDITPGIEKMVARLRSIGGAIRFINSPDSCSLSHGAWIAYIRITDVHSSLDDPDITLAQCACQQHKETYRDLYRARTAEIKVRKQQYDRARISSALRSGSTKCLIHPGDDPEAVKQLTRDYWSNLYTHEPAPAIPKPWLTTKSILDIKEQVSASPLSWPRPASLIEFRALLRKGTPRPAPASAKAQFTRHLLIL
ncbi:hypothetical protein B0H13DRAFT_2358865 [Mycena leptocephala]|nr:hypothetical protein B0H13DRAFT_2358865 [Mycena leptocephala]